MEWKRNVEPWLAWGPSQQLHRPESVASLWPSHSSWGRDSGSDSVWTSSGTGWGTPSWSWPGLSLVCLVLSHSPSFSRNCRLQLFLFTAHRFWVLHTISMQYAMQYTVKTNKVRSCWEFLKIQLKNSSTIKNPFFKQLLFIQPCRPETTSADCSTALHCTDTAEAWVQAEEKWLSQALNYNYCDL